MLKNSLTCIFDKPILSGLVYLYIYDFLIEIPTKIPDKTKSWKISSLSNRQICLVVEVIRAFSLYTFFSIEIQNKNYEFFYSFKIIRISKYV